MTMLTASQIAQYAKGAGLPNSAVPYAVAIALAESGGRTDAHNAIPPDNSYGLWQINMLGSMGPARRQQFGLSSNSQLFDPATNARAMKAISNNGSNWIPWTTYTSGAYLRFMGQAKGAASSPTAEVSDPATTMVSDYAAIQKGADTLTNRGMWIRIGLFLGGSFLALVAIVKSAGASSAATSAAKAAVKVVV